MSQFEHRDCDGWKAAAEPILTHPFSARNDTGIKRYITIYSYRGIVFTGGCSVVETGIRRREAGSFVLPPREWQGSSPFLEAIVSRVKHVPPV